jgi:hypothetical protein
MIDKETFIDTINFLEAMIKKNKKDSDSILFLKRILILLPLSLPNRYDAKEAIEAYCFDQNFGKPSPESEYITPGELYEKLM